MLWFSAAQAACLLITGAEVFDGTTQGPDTVLIADGTLARLGGDEASWQGAPCETVQTEGVVTPGLVDAWSHVGLAEVGLEHGTVDHEGEGDPIRASLVVSDAYNPMSIRVPLYRSQGITHTWLVPTGGLVSGQIGLAQLAGDTQSDTVVLRGGPVLAGLTGRSKAQALATLRALLEDARAYRRNRAAVHGNRYRDFVEGASRHDLDALGPILSGEHRLFVEVDRASDIEAVLRLAEQLGVEVGIVGGAEAWRLAEQLASAEVPVVLDPMVYGAGSFDQIHGRADNAALLAEAGVELGMRALGNANAPALRQYAGNAVRDGLSHDRALRAITAGPARMLGTDVGVLVVGQPANLVLWSGDPLELSTHAERVWIGGQERVLTTRQDALLEHYREL